MEPTNPVHQLPTQDCAEEKKQTHPRSVIQVFAGHPADMLLGRPLRLQRPSPSAKNTAHTPCEAVWHGRTPAHCPTNL